MNQQEFILDKLAKMALHFPQVHIKYDFNKLIQTHIIELSPVEEFENNKKLDEEWIPFSFEFMQKFPGADIAFISPESSLRIINPTEEFNAPLCESLILEEIFGEISGTLLNYSFPTSIPVNGSVIGLSIAPIFYPKVEIDFPLEDELYYQSAA
ncbi:MAG: hypothetical protein JNK20_02145 [Flavipsychrobacter sp.]|nr:hypothetical protein [Flavipsychrobacter sp.]